MNSTKRKHAPIVNRTEYTAAGCQPLNMPSRPTAVKASDISIAATIDIRNVIEPKSSLQHAYRLTSSFFIVEHVVKVEPDQFFIGLKIDLTRP